VKNTSFTLSKLVEEWYRSAKKKAESYGNGCVPALVMKYLTLKEKSKEDKHLKGALVCFPPTCGRHYQKDNHLFLLSKKENTLQVHRRKAF